MPALQNFYYANQLRNYLIQFMAIFADMQVQVGKSDLGDPRLVKVHVRSGSRDRVVASLLSENTQNKLIRLPAISAHLISLDLAPERRKGIPAHRRSTHMPTGQVFPDDIKVVEQRQPVPYNATYELSIWASNQDQHYQILEQILMLFNPMLQIQTSEEIFDWTKITHVELKNIGLEENYPAGNDRRMIRTSLTFEMPIYLSVPVDIHQRYVKDIYMRIGAVSQIATTSEDVIAELDSQGIAYDLNFSLDDIDLTAVPEE